MRDWTVGRRLTLLGLRQSGCLERIVTVRLIRSDELSSSSLSLRRPTQKRIVSASCGNPDKKAQKKKNEGQFLLLTMICSAAAGEYYETM